MTDIERLCHRHDDLSKSLTCAKDALRHLPGHIGAGTGNLYIAGADLSLTSAIAAIATALRLIGLDIAAAEEMEDAE